MSFLAHLEQVISQVPGAIACALMGFDGITVETHQAEDASELELSTAWIEYSGVLGQLKQAAEQLKTGAMSEVTINTEKCVTFVRMVSPEYFLVLALKPDGNFG